MTIQNSMDKDKIVYFGVININENGRTIGAVDVWRSVITKELFCEEKRLGILDIVDYIGMPKKNTNEKWCIAINKNRAGKDRWKLIKIIKEGKVSFYDTDDESIVETIVHDYKISDNTWWSFLVEKYINKTVEISKELRIP